MRAVYVAVLIACTATAAHAQIGSTSPGKLGAAHAALEQQCNRCHVPFGGIPNERCLACHTNLAGRIARGIGLHAGVKAQTCVTCHKDHHGRDAQLSPAPTGFDHNKAAFHLDGAHANLACERCHPSAGSSRRWVGIATQCESCHPDRAHKGGFGSTCSKCHAAIGWKPPSYTAKDHVTPLGGGHAALTCRDCHNGGIHLAPKQSCDTCHARNHAGTEAACRTCHDVAAWTKVTYVHSFPPSRLPGKHQAARCLQCHPAFRFAKTSLECAACHDKDRPHEPLGPCGQCHSALSWKGKARTFDHDKPSIAFPLTGKHAQVACEGCHPTAGKFSVAKRTCAGCHPTPAHGDFGACQKCHATEGWQPASFDHGKTRMPLDGAHVAVPCQSCHEPLATTPYKPGRASCRGCHPDPHAGQFEGPAARAARTDPTLFATPQVPHVVRAGRECIDCHTTDRWSPSKITAENHGDFGFVLRGAHTSLECKQCHVAGKYAGTTHDCIGCHSDDRHLGRFGTRCTDCHDENAWKPVPTFEHARTGFALKNGHANVGCARCHGADGKKLVGVAEPTECGTCHQPPHGKQFGTGCRSCHTTVSFHHVPKFDHDTTAFRLELRHATLPCLQCHDARTRPMIDRNCRSCHGDPHRGSNSFDCADCHRPDRWRIIRFDHDLTSFPLTGTHRITSCGNCHTNPNWTGIRTDCVACHAFDRPRTQDHLTKVSCEDCHTTTNWRITHH